MENTYCYTSNNNEKNNGKQRNEIVKAPLSFAQRRLWFINQLDPDNTSYNLVNAVVIRGNINIKLLEQSINKIVMRHEPLRAVFISSEDNVFQLIKPDLYIKINFVRVNEETYNNKIRYVNNIIENECKFVFNLSEGPLLRVYLLEINPDEYVFIFNIHHIISDAWSIRLFIKELIDIYSAKLRGRSSVLDPPDLTYSDYAFMQIKAFEDGLYKEDILYWSEKLKDISAFLSLPTDFPRPGQLSSQGSSISYIIDKKMAKSLFEFAKREKTTVFMILLSCFYILLRKVTGEEDILVGTPLSGRNSLKIEPLIGFFSNMVVLRTQVKSGLSFRQLSKNVSDTVLEAYDHQNLPFDKLIEILNPERVISASPLFQVFFSYQNNVPKVRNFENLIFERFPVKRYTSRFDLSFEVEECDQDLFIEIEYNTSLFTYHTIKQLYSCFIKIAESVVSDPDISISQINMINDSERKTLLMDWNNTWSVYPYDKCVHQLFEEQTKINGNKTAAIQGSDSVTYSELDLKARNLACCLLKHGVNAGDRVGIYMDTGLPAVISILGIWKAGCCYVPLDPLYPAKRIEDIIKDSMLKAVITGDDEPGLENIRNIKVIKFSDVGNFMEPIEDKSTSRVTPDSLAYILYTSGTTGKPKGVMINHRSVVNFLCSMKREPGIKEDDMLLSVTNITFDISILEMFLPLVSGATVILLSRDERQDAGKLKELIELLSPTIIQATPAMWKILLSTGWKGDKKKLKILCGGERLEKRLADELLKRGYELWNMYGPTETTVWSLIYKVRGTEKEIPVGRPIANTYVYILDDSMNPLPIGVAGNIYIGGDGVAVGYNNMNEETQRKFIQNTLGKEGRIYYTGDKGKFGKDGLVYYLGRDDHQLKIRGYRVEAQEVENKICSFNGVEDCIVTALTNETGENSLVAYIKKYNGSYYDINEDDMYNYLNKQLPGYMIPSCLIFVDEFPLNAHGKVDRKRLPSLSQKHRDKINGYESPEDETGRMMVKIWEDVLKTSPVRISDNFFRTGGHSILAVKLVREINEKLDTDISLKDLFKRPVLMDLCNHVRNLRKENRKSEGLPLFTIKPNKEDRYKPFPLTDIQRAYWLGRNSSLGLGGVATHIYQEFEVVDLDIERFNKALQRLIGRHDMLRVIVLPEGRQMVLKEVPSYKIGVNDMRGRNKEEIEASVNEIRKVMSHQVKPADQWPLFDIKATITGNRSTILHISFDLMIADAWSLQILMNEIALLYENPERELQELEICFRDYVMALNEMEKAGMFERARQYWMKRIDSIPGGPALTLITDPGSISRPGFKRLSYVLDSHKWEKLKQQAGKFNITSNGILLAAFSEVLAKWSKESHFTLNVTIFNRLPLHQQINEIVGDFTSLLLFEVNNSESDNFLDRAKRIQETLWNDMDHRYFCGTRVMRELIRNGYSKSTMPVVYTSLLGFSNPDHFRNVFLRSNSGKEYFGISQTPQVWLDHQVSEADGALVFNWDFVDIIFPPGMIEEMFETYCRFLMYLCEEKSWSQNSPLDHSIERGRIKSVDNKEKQDIPEKMLHTLFMYNAAKNPDRKAVIAVDRELTYDELDRISDVIASQLSNRYHQYRSIIAVYMEKGWEQIAAVLGILKAGCAYLPIDPDLPEERVHYLLQKANVKVVLARKNTQQALANHGNIEVLTVSDDLFNLNVEYELPPEQDSKSLAYVIFTSGSTGLPKGVMIDHGGAVNTILDVNSKFCITPEDRVLAISSLSFDLSVYDIFGTLAAGGAIVIPDLRKLRDPEHWAELIGKHKVTVWNSVPALMNMLVNSKINDLSSSLSSLRLVLLSGDWIPLYLPDEIKKIYPEIKVISLGGATEASIWSIFFPVDDIDPAWKSIPYGQPLANQSVYVMDNDMEVCPVWVTGELYIGGRGIALGYLGDEEKTKNSFLVHPKTGERLYRTGDLGRYMPDGNIELLGRKDNQVKIQGFRIELGEIESVIKESLFVRDAVVSAVGEMQGNKRLCAFIIPDYENINHAKSPDDSENIIQETAERLDFKVREHGIRKDLQGDVIELTKPKLSVDEYICRRSYRKFDRTAINFDDFSSFLSCLLQVELKGVPFPKYMYASGGGLYPVQVYIYVKDGSVTGMRQGIYYFNPKKKVLIFISDARIDQTIHVPENQPVFNESAFSVFLIAKMDAIIPMYGRNKSVKYCLIEAGAISQLLEMHAPKNNIGLCQIGVLNFELIKPFFRLDDDCVFLHSLVGGYISAEQQTPEAIVSEWQEYGSRKNELMDNSVIDTYIDRLREYLTGKLPYYMVPTGFQILNEFPLTANGKIDRAALEAMGRSLYENVPEKNVRSTDNCDASAVHDIDRDISGIILNAWKTVFKIDAIGINANFFDLGGDSLLLTQVHKILEKELGMELKIVDLFRYPTIRSLTRYLSGTKTADEHDFKPSRAELRLKQRELRSRKLKS